MKIHKKNLDEYLKNFRLIIGNSDIKFRKHTDKIATWPDSGDILTINTEKNKLLSVKIMREEYAEEKNLTDKKKEGYTFEFDVKDASSEVSKISDHLIFVDIKNIKLPTNLSDQSDIENPAISYDLEMVIRCDCGFNLRTKKHHTTFFFYENSETSDSKHAHHDDPQATNNSGGGGGWSSPPK